MKRGSACTLKYGRIEMVRGQMRLMTNKSIRDGSAVTACTDEEAKEVVEEEGCGKMNISDVYWDKIVSG